MEKRNRDTNSGSILEADATGFQRTTFRMQQPNRYTEPKSGSSISGRRGVTEVDGAAHTTQQYHRMFNTDTDFQRAGGDIIQDGIRSTGWSQLHSQDYYPFVDQFPRRRSFSKVEEGKLTAGSEGRVDQERVSRNTYEGGPRPASTQLYPAQEIEPIQVIAAQTLPISFSMEPDYLNDADLYAPPPDQPLTFLNQGFTATPFVPFFVIDQTLSSSSSSGSYHSFSSSFSSSSPPEIGGSASVPTPPVDPERLEGFDMSRMATDIASIQLDDAEMDDTEMAANQHGEICDVDPETTANQLRRLFQQNEDGDTILHLAILEGVTESTMVSIIRLFGERHLLNVPNNLQQTPLHLATITRRDDVITHLLKNGARRKVFDRNLDTPLHIASRQGHATRVTALQPANEDQELKQELRDVAESSNKEGQTCLHVAAINGHLDIVQYLVEDCKINVNLKELRRGRTILHLAVEQRNFELVHYLLSLHDSYELLADFLTYDRYSALQMAQMMSQGRIENLFLLAGVQPIVDVDAS